MCSYACSAKGDKARFQANGILYTNKDFLKFPIFELGPNTFQFSPVLRSTDIP